MRTGLTVNIIVTISEKQARGVSKSRTFLHSKKVNFRVHMEGWYPAGLDFEISVYFSGLPTKVKKPLTIVGDVTGKLAIIVVSPHDGC